MKKILLVLLINLLIPIVSFSQITYPKILNDSLIIITNKQLKQTNLIFIEHNKYKNLIPVYKNKIEVLNSLNSVLENKDSINKLMIINYNKDINNLNKSLKIKNRQIKILKYSIFGSLSISIGLFIFVLCQ